MASKTIELKASIDGAFTIRRLRAWAPAAVLALTCASIAGPAVARTAFDGDWSVLIVTRGGACEPASRFGVQIANGIVIAGGGGAAVQGRVAPGGAVRVTVQSGGQWANGSGHLNLTRGSGVWRGQGNAGTCSGTWVAQRSGYAPQAAGPRGPIYNYAPQYYGDQW